MLYYLLAVFYVVACLLLLLVVLLQQGKGGDMASAFGGGGSQTAFGARAGATVLTKATAILGVLFMLGAIVARDHGPARPRLADARPRQPRPPRHRPAAAPVDRAGARGDDAVRTGSDRVRRTQPKK